MELLKRLSLFTLLGSALALPAFSATPLVVGQTYNTGYNSVTNTALAPGSSDLYFNLFSYAGTTPVVTSPDSPLWVQAAGAQWISPVEDQSGNPGSGSPTGAYDYKAYLATDFVMPTSVTVSGSFAADDGTVLYVDGTMVTTVGPEAYTALTSFSYTFSISSGPVFVPIDFVVNNTNSGGSQSTNPTGLLVSGLKFTTGTATPEPATWVLLFAGIGALLLMRRVRASSAS
jgi:hypothetical protein